MDTREDLENIKSTSAEEYFGDFLRNEGIFNGDIEESIKKGIDEIRLPFFDRIQALVSFHANTIIEKYGNWRKYPRKIKKYLKKKNWWTLRYSEKTSKEDFRVVLNPTYEKHPFTLEYTEFK